MTTRPRSFPTGNDQKEQPKVEVVLVPSGGAGEGYGNEQRPSLGQVSPGTTSGNDQDRASQSNPRAQGRDRGYLQSDGTQIPTAEVLAERKRRIKSYPKALREQAYRERAFMQAQLIACECAYPLVKADTPSGHEPWCMAEVWRAERERNQP